MSSTRLTIDFHIRAQLCIDNDNLRITLVPSHYYSKVLDWKESNDFPTLGSRLCRFIPFWWVGQSIYYNKGVHVNLWCMHVLACAPSSRVLSPTSKFSPAGEPHSRHSQKLIAPNPESNEAVFPFLLPALIRLVHRLCLASRPTSSLRHWGKRM